jgi:predicted AAA+ superfamily ATPase
MPSVRNFNPSAANPPAASPPHNTQVSWEVNWDNPTHRKQIADGPDAVAEELGLNALRDQAPSITFDEIHKHSRWKNWLKGFFDIHADHCRVLVTGSSRVDVFRRGGDSLMGRYFHYRMHPMSVAELLDPSSILEAGLLREPRALLEADWQALWEHGGFPEPFLHRNPAFSRRWHDSRTQQVLREDIRDLTLVREVDFVVIRDQKPWFLVEVKHTNDRLSPALGY